ncbi:type II secretion system F family protein|uniref:type II secretion system F family protein n=1 Tax=Noviherbaspirillum sp. L7-7A TaxID=2850560 RepID=UPI001C2BB58F|nr:type II secretion system F family protein [Noviherbaspirillum sp. L7-7A]MBV0881072.1 type II secretion system F family protein [Noviherbaspirillum sp. L7-7A]
MLKPDGSNAFLILSVLVFIAVLLALEGLYLVWKSYRGPEARKIQQRLDALSASSGSERDNKLLKDQKFSDVPSIERLLLKFPISHDLQGLIHQAGLKWTVSKLLLSSIAVGFCSYMIINILVHQTALWAGMTSILAATLPWFYVKRKRALRLRKIENQLPDALDLLVRALRSGHAFSSGLQMLGEEMAEPIAGEFRIVHEEVNFGVSLQQALMNLGNRVPITDLRYFIVAVLIQRESGGNLTEVLSNLSRLIRERLKLLGRVRVLSSEGRLSAWILAIMPFALAGLMSLMNPDFMAPLWNDPLGATFIKALLSLMGIGILVLIKIIKIRV